MDSSNYAAGIMYAGNVAIKVFTIAKLTSNVAGGKWYHKGGFAGYVMRKYGKRQSNRRLIQRFPAEERQMDCGSSGTMWRRYVLAFTTGAQGNFLPFPGKKD